MNQISKYCVSITTSIREALRKLNSLSGDSQVLLVLDEQERIVGTLTDGDIRRGLIDGYELSEPVYTVAHRDFCCINCDDDLISKIREFRSNRIRLLPLINYDGRVIDVIDLNHQRSLLPLDAVLMAGGKGERLRPLTEKTPKPLLKVGDKAIIDYNVDRLISYGVKHISVTVNYLKEQIEEHFAMLRDGIKIDTVTEPNYLGTIGSVQFVNMFYNDTVLVMNSDLFTNIDYEDFYLHFKDNNADMSIAAVPYSVSVPYGILDLEDRNVKGILEKPTYNYYANAGIYLIKREMLKLIPENTFFNATDLLNLLVEKNKKVVRYPLNGTWIDIGNFQEYQKACELMKHMRF